MSERNSFLKKLAYGVAIAVLLFPLSMLSSPASVTPQQLAQRELSGGQSGTGGVLSKLRTEYGLGQANLGEIDPASETMRLVTMGFRGLAMNLLWEQANHYKKTEDWSNLTATLEQLAKLQPNFITFWKFQAWNLSYNVSVEFDDYRDRYYYVRRGIDFLKKGERYNRDSVQLLWDLGWFIGQKIGRADEHVQYRRLFKADDDFHDPDTPPERRDNWLNGKVWYEKTVDVIDLEPSKLGRKSPKIVFSSPAMSQMNYAEAIEEEGFFRKAERAWRQASTEWREFGDRVIEHSTGVRLQLNDEPKLTALLEDLRSELDVLLPGVRQTLLEEKRNQLTSEERNAIDTPNAERTDAQYELAYQAEGKIVITDRDVAERIAKENPELANQAYKQAGEIARTDLQLRYTRNYKNDSNFDYWDIRAQFEQTPDALQARESLYLGRRAFVEENDLLKAKQLYDEGFLAWRRVFDRFPKALDEDSTTGDDVMEYIKKYREILDQLEGTLPDDFPLWDVVENFDSEQLFRDEVAERKKRRQMTSQSGQDEVEDSPRSEQEVPTTSDQPAETEPAETEPAETEPAETEPAETEPAETEPAETEPAETEPAETEPAETEPAETEPAETEPAETEPAETEPAETEPAETEPAETEPAETEPAETEPAETEPAETEPAETEPAETEPAETEPAEIESAEKETIDGDSVEETVEESASES